MTATMALLNNTDVNITAFYSQIPTTSQVDSLL